MYTSHLHDAARRLCERVIACFHFIHFACIALATTDAVMCTARLVEVGGVQNAMSQR